MLIFIYFGRLTYDKGIDIILDTFSALAADSTTDSRQLHIYGTGPYTPQCIQEAQTDSQITYHGRAKQEAIHERLQSAHYCLAPSRVVETFGKSALEAMQYGLPVIGFKKWWLGQFVTDEFAIDASDPVTHLTAIIKELLIQYTLTWVLPDRAVSQATAAAYSKDAWLTKVDQIIAPKEQPTSIDTQNTDTHKAPNTAQTILYISDFISQIGWIETFLHESWALLQMHNYRVTLYGGTGRVSFLWLIYTACNIPARRKTRRLAHKIKPTVIRYHSLFRRLWWTAILPKSAATKHLITIHDLGYFHPYPSQLYDEKAIPAFTLQSWQAYGKTPVQKLLITAKFFSLALLHKRLSHTIDTRCVPSAFMVDILHHSRGIPKDRIIVLPHFTS